MVVRNRQILENQVRLQKEIDFIVKILLRSFLLLDKEQKQKLFLPGLSWLVVEG